MTYIKSIFRAIYGCVWRNPKERLTARLKEACDSMPPKRRLTAVSLMLAMFVLTAFFVFGHACYRIGLGKAQKPLEIEHICPIDIITKSPVHEPQNLPGYDDTGMENED
ncbi:hypothetical protein IMSAGC008_01283 [Muribaculaceae bacterium]|nr:hypothetical protein IMSAGC008_01283 [Muribaculaceae bacterium]